jgi:hypothetical protein
VARGKTPTRTPISAIKSNKLSLDCEIGRKNDDFWIDQKTIFFNNFKARQ